MFCIPIPHDQSKMKTPWVVAAIALVDALLLIPVFGGHRGLLFLHYGFVPARATLLTLFTAMFLHTGFWHYAGNMWFFWLFGRKVEATLGHVKFLLLFLVSGAGGQMIYWLVKMHSGVPCIGASGAISGIAGMYLVLYPRDKFDLDLYIGLWRVKSIESDARFAVGAWIGEQVLLALLTMFVPFSSTAFWNHVGGFAVGLAFGIVYLWLTPPEDVPAPAGPRPIAVVRVSEPPHAG